LTPIRRVEKRANLGGGKKMGRKHDNPAGLFDLSGKVAVITGGGGVLLGTVSRALGRAGVKVAILDLIPKAARKVEHEIVSAGGEAIAVKCNVLDKASLEAACRTIQKRFGRLDILLNGAGGNKKEATTSPDLSFFELPPKAVQSVFELNFMGTLLPSQVFGRVLAEQGEGVILNISSMNAFRPLTKIPAYSAAKAAVTNFTQWLAVHMSQEYSDKIRVNAIAPGFFMTQQNRFLLTDEATGRLTLRGKSIIDHTPMGRFGKPEDLISTVLWLLSPAAAFVHGVVVPVDGGFSAFSGV
jgi:NAD(P)-dependent dehydrogenase (short-subunit alcohol dehydrogenase family)